MTRPPAADAARLADLGGRLVRAGFLLAGWFAPGTDDGVPPLGDGRRAAALLLVGSLSNALLPILRRQPEWSDGAPDPLDRYTRSALVPIARAAGMDILFPFDGPPYLPFQRWALRCGGLSRSPMGLLAHRAFGPWLGLRAALLTPVPVRRPAGADGPCASCADAPCVTACPAGALSRSDGYDVAACRGYLGAHPEAACHAGCLSRHACPVGQRHRQTPEAGAFHMAAFTGAPPTAPRPSDRGRR